MADKFKVGDICIIIGSDSFPEIIGTEVTITGVPTFLYNYVQNRMWQGYPTDLIHKGCPIFPKEHNLRLKRKKGEQKVFDMFESLNVTKEKVEELV